MAEAADQQQHQQDPLLHQFRSVRDESVALCAPLAIEDYGVQPMDDASPPKWHLAHTSWFFETFVLKPLIEGYAPFHDRYEYLFNSYYNGVGQPYPRPRRGLLSRPTVAEILEYRAHVDSAVTALLQAGRGDNMARERLVLGLHHEQQHQELMLTDLKYNLGHNPLYPAYRSDLPGPGDQTPRTLDFRSFEGGVVTVGAAGEAFCFDNETPRHEVLIPPFQLADRLVTNAEYLAFIADDGYQRPELWLSEGWARITAEEWRQPLYWQRADAGWLEYRLAGLQPLEPAAPVVHLSGFEADAYARWAGCRLPTEFEWEAAAEGEPVAGNFANGGALHPRPCGDAATQTYGDVWEWTASSYGAYPGYRPLPGTLGEYNGKFMSSQLVLRGGSCATPAGHVRPSYRNFFYPGDRWQFTGLRLARDPDQ